MTPRRRKHTGQTHELFHQMCALIGSSQTPWVGRTYFRLSLCIKRSSSSVLRIAEAWMMNWRCGILCIARSSNSPTRRQEWSQDNNSQTFLTYDMPANILKTS